jgi:hypothetical protein
MRDPTVCCWRSPAATKSPSILGAIEATRQCKVGVIGLTSESGGRMGAVCALRKSVPTKSTPRMQEMHTYHRAHDLRNFGGDVYERVKEGIQNLLG